VLGTYQILQSKQSLFAPYRNEWADGSRMIEWKLGLIEQIKSINLHSMPQRLFDGFSNC